MENKEYYTPTIEELFVGYELESLYVNEDSGFCPEVLDNEGLYHCIKELQQKIGLVNYRTVFLCKQDIIDLKWVHQSTVGDNIHMFKMGASIMSFDSKDRNIRIIDNRGISIFDGWVKSKNELKKLIKDYLNIHI